MHGGSVPAPIFLLTGTPGAGKSSVALALLQRFAAGIHIPVDNLRELVVVGRADPVPTWTDATAQQFALARRSAADMARRYARAGFAVAIDDVIFPSEAEALFAVPLAEVTTLHKVWLCPNVDVALARNAQRTSKTFDVHVLATPIEQIHAAMSQHPFAAYGWHIINSSALNVEQTVEQIFALCALSKPCAAATLR